MTGMPVKKPFRKGRKGFSRKFGCGYLVHVNDSLFDGVHHQADTALYV